MNDQIDYRTPQVILMEKESLQILEEVLSTLIERERIVIELRFGLFGDLPMTLKEVGKLLKVSQERVRQIQNKALRKLRHPRRSRKLFDAFFYFKDWEKEDEERKKEDDRQWKGALSKASQNNNNYVHHTTIEDINKFWEHRKKFTKVIYSDVIHPYYLPSNTNQEKIIRILAYSEYYSTSLEELKLIFSEEDIALCQ